MFEKLDRRTLLILLAVTVTAMCLSVIRLGYQPLWLDEAITWFRAHQSIPAIVRGVQSSEPHGAFYYVVMKFWVVFSDSEFWLRAFSVLCFTLTAPVVFVIGWTMSGRRAGLYAACLTATAPFLIWHAQEARMYAMLLLFCGLALMSTALIVSKPSARPPAVIGQGLRGLWRRRRGASISMEPSDDLLWAVYIVAVLGGMLSHHTALLLPALTALIFLVAIAAAPQYRWLRLRNLIAANLVALGLYAFNIPLLLSNVEAFVQQKPMGMDPEFLKMMRMVFINVYGNRYLPEQAIALAALCIFALWGWRRRKDWKWVGFSVIGTLGLPLALAAASVFFPFVFADRVIIWTVIPFYAACAAGIARLPRAGLRLIVLGGLLLCNLYGVWHEWERRIREPWAQVAQTVAQAASNDGAVALCPGWVRAPFSYYWRRHERDLAVFGEQDSQMVSLFTEPADGDVAKLNRRGEIRTYASLFDDHSELWIVTRGSVTFTYCSLPALQDMLSGYGRLVAFRDFGVGFEVFAFARDDGPAAPD